jgi:hypothetical protein
MAVLAGLGFKGFSPEKQLVMPLFILLQGGLFNVVVLRKQAIAVFFQNGQPLVHFLLARFVDLTQIFLKFPSLHEMGMFDLI